MELPLWRNFITTQRAPKIFISISFTLIILGLIPLYNYHPYYSLILLNHTSISPTPSYRVNSVQTIKTDRPADDRRIKIDRAVNVQRIKIERPADDQDEEVCDVFRGDWVPNLDGPYYTNETCWAIHEHQNCMKYGRPDTEFMKWRWKPRGCAPLPIFNPYQFLDMMRNKSMAFIGDSVGRNQMQSLICLLSRVEYPIDISYDSDQNFKRWNYTTYNFTLASYWSPFLVKTKESNPDGPTHTGVFNLYLDQPDPKWSTQIQDFNYVILNSAHWFTRCSVYYEKDRIIGCRYCGLPNVTEIPIQIGHQKALKTTLRAINRLKDYKGVTFLRTIAPAHFEGGDWNKGGNCVRKGPFMSNETKLEGLSLQFYETQVEEFKVAFEEGLRSGKKFRLFDMTHAMLLRPDGHPSKYGHWPNANVVLYNDCVHWCLPGPIDTWSDFLLHMLKMEGKRKNLEENI